MLFNLPKIAEEEVEKCIEKFWQKKHRHPGKIKIKTETFQKICPKMKIKYKGMKVCLDDFFEEDVIILADNVPSVSIVVPVFQIKGRNQIKNKWKYYEYLQELKQLIYAYSKDKEHHFDSLVDIYIIGYFANKKVSLDCSNLPDKIVIDSLLRYSMVKLPNGKMKRVENKCWFIEDDDLRYVRRTIKESRLGDSNRLEVYIKEVEK